MRVSGVPYEVDLPKDVHPMKFTFIHEGANYDYDSDIINDRLTRELIVTDMMSWTEVHHAFLDFLGAAYGYNIKEQVLNDTNTSNNSGLSS